MLGSREQGCSTRAALPQGRGNKVKPSWHFSLPVGDLMSHEPPQSCAPQNKKSMQRLCQKAASSAAAVGPSSLMAACVAAPRARGLAKAAGRVVVGGADGSAKRKSRMPQKAVLDMTENAAMRISELLQRRQESGDPAVAVRVGVKTRGCNGLSYTMNYASEKAKLEEEVEQHGARIFVEPKALMHVIGTTMDFVEDDLSSEFVFHNPNAEASCGCGESFTVGTQKR